MSTTCTCSDCTRRRQGAMDHDAIQRILDRCSYHRPGGETITFHYNLDGLSGITVYVEKCRDTAPPHPVRHPDTAFRYTSSSVRPAPPLRTPEDVVRAAYRAVMDMESHERGERFRVAGKALFNPHAQRLFEADLSVSASFSPEEVVYDYETVMHGDQLRRILAQLLPPESREMG